MEEDVAITHAVLSTRLDNLENKVDTLTKHIEELLALKHKGLGAFWLVSIIAAAIFATAVSGISGWLRG